MSRRLISWAAGIAVVAAAAVVVSYTLYSGPAVDSSEQTSAVSDAAPTDATHASTERPDSAGLAEETVATVPAGVKKPPVPQPPRIIREQGIRKRAEQLIEQGGASAGEELAELHPAADISTRRLIERHAAEKDEALKKTLVAQSVVSLNSEDSGEKIAGLETLRFLAAPDGAEKALALLSDEEPAEVCAASIAYLGRVNHEEAFEKVLSLAGSQEDKAVEATAIRNLPLMGGKKNPDRTVSVLAKALESEDPAVQAEALGALGRFLDKITPETRGRIEALAKIDAENRDEKRVKESAAMLLDHLEALEK